MSTSSFITKKKLTLSFLPIFSVIFFYSYLGVSWNFPRVKSQSASSSSYIVNEGSFGTDGWTNATSSSFIFSSETALDLSSNPYGSFAGNGFFSGSITDPLTYTTLTIDQTNIDLGSLSPGIFSDRTSTLLTKTNNPSGYRLYAQASSPLTISDGIQIIPHTTCDPDLPCQLYSASPWLQTDSYGFGFNISGDNIDEDFAEENFFRPFADKTAGEDFAEIAWQDGIYTPDQEFRNQIKYRVNVSGDQTAGVYQNNIYYLASPNL